MRSRLAHRISLLVLVFAAACDSRGAVGDDLAVHLLTMANGAGTSRAVNRGGAALFTWSSTPAAKRFEIQFDDSCASTKACAFPSPELDEKALLSPTYSLGALPSRPSGPVAIRYFWHVRACSDQTCGDWSPTRYIIWGGTHGRIFDLNGDGFEDAVVAAPNSSAGGEFAGSAYVYLGGDPITSTPALTLHHDHAFDLFGHSVAMLGDVNDDGYGDYLVRSQGDQSTPSVAPAAHAYVYLGRPVLSATPDYVLDCPSVDDENGAAAGIGDVNGDGYDDFAIGGATVDAQHHAEPTPRVEVHFGGPTLANAPDLVLFGEPNNGTGDFFGSSIAGVGDVNDDGYADFAVGAHGFGKVRIYFGGAGLDATPDKTLVSSLNRDGEKLFGFAVAAAGDFNGDGIGDIAIGAPATDASAGPPGMAFVYFGGPTIADIPSVSLASKKQGDWFGKVLAGMGDVDGDGRDDLAVMTPGADPSVGHPVEEAGEPIQRVTVFRGGPGPSATEAFSHVAGPATRERLGLGACDLDGDSLPELLVGRQFTGFPGLGGVDVVQGVPSTDGVTMFWTSHMPGDAFGAAIAR
jgi:hypothetical protein